MNMTKPEGSRVVTRYQARVLNDFFHARKIPSSVTLTVSILGIAASLVAQMPQVVLVLTAALCGGLLGSWVEKRHLNDLSVAIAKVVNAHAKHKRNETSR